MALYEVYVLKTSNHAVNEDGETIAGKCKELRTAKQARKFIADWLLHQTFDPKNGDKVLAVRPGADGKPLTAKIALEHHDIDDIEVVQKRNLTLVKATGAKEGQQWVKTYTVVKVTVPGGGAATWGVQEIKPEPVKAEAAKK